jgi:hypothetical protein
MPPRKPQPLSRRTFLGRSLAGAIALTPLALLAPATSLATSPRPAAPTPVDEFDAGVATAWFDELLELIRATPGFSPPVASRALGYAGVALYESVLPGLRGRRSLAGLLTDLPPLPATGRNGGYAWPVVANAALAEITRSLFPTAPVDRLAAIERLEASVAAAAPRGVRERSIQRGQAIAQAIFTWSMTDGGHEGYLHSVDPAYVPPVGPGLWTPTPPSFLPPLQPRWGANRPFAARSASVTVAEPVPYSIEPGSACHAQGLEVHETVNHLTEEQLAIARFWSDDPRTTATPAGHSVSILTQVLRSRDTSLAEAVEGYARLGIALADAFISCWRTKYRHNVLRPISYIAAVIDPAWGGTLPLVTPPFPEYTSGHSVQSGAAAAVLSSMFGAVAFTDRTHEARGLAARSFASFDAAASEAAISRLYGGIHFRAAIERGLEQGRAIGEVAARLPLEA